MLNQPTEDACDRLINSIDQWCDTMVTKIDTLEATILNYLNKQHNQERETEDNSSVEIPTNL